jgi:hypothetical protein
MPYKRSRGIDRDKYPLNPGLQMTVARKIARLLRNEHAMDYPPIQMIGGVQLPRDEAARRMDEQADRWEAEIRTGQPNTLDRGRMGC